MIETRWLILCVALLAAGGCTRRSAQTRAAT
jgi:hypothetical protein